jgi:hypothetical protein
MTTVTISDLKAIFNVALKGMARFTFRRHAAIIEDRKERRVMAIQTDKQNITPTPKAGRPTDPNQVADRVAVRTEDLSDEDIAAVEASEMAPGFEYLDAELEPAGASVVEVGGDFARKLRARGNAAMGRPADKAFRDSLFDDS